MPTLDSIVFYDFESQIELGAKGILIAGLASITPALPPVQVLRSQDEDTLTVPRLECMFETTRPILQYTAAGQASPKQVPTAFEGTLSVLVATGRIQDDARMSPIHGSLRAIVRYFFSAGAKQWNDSNLPNLQILEILPAGMRAQLQQDKAQDYDVLQFAVKFAVKPSVWPAIA